MLLGNDRYKMINHFGLYCNAGVGASIQLKPTTIEFYGVKTQT
jgi:hypothetical protein